MMESNDRRGLAWRHAEDDVSMIEVARMLMARKTLIVAVAAGTLLAAILYLAVVPAMYEGNVKLLVPNAETVVLTAPHHPYAEFKSEPLFKDFLAMLRLREHWRQFVASAPELFPNAGDDPTTLLLNPVPLIFGQEKDFPRSHAHVSYLHQDPAVSATTLQRYLEFTRNRFVSDLVESVKSRLDLSKTTLAMDLVLLREKAKMSREDEIARLQHDLALARKLGINVNVLLRSSGNSAGRNDIAIIAANEMVRGYMRGTAVLEAELDALLKRETDDPYIVDLREKQIEIERLNGYRFAVENFQPYIQDGDIVTPAYPVKPRKKLVILLATVLGLMLGVIAAFAAEFIAAARLRPAAAA